MRPMEPPTQTPAVPLAARPSSTERTGLTLPREVPVPLESLELLKAVALGHSGQARAVRHLLMLLVGFVDAKAFPGEGLLEMRLLDQPLAEAYLEVVIWWRGPVRSDQPVYNVLRAVAEEISGPRSARRRA